MVWTSLLWGCKGTEAPRGSWPCELLMDAPEYQRQSCHDCCNTSSMDLRIEGDAPPKYSPCCDRWLRWILHWCLHPSYLSCMDDINLRATLYTNLCTMHSPMRDTLVQSLSKSPYQLWNSWSKCLTSNSLMSFLTSASFESRGWDFSRGEGL